LSARTYAESLSIADQIREPAIRQAIKALALPVGSVGLDTGCGIGQHTQWLADEVGLDGMVTGLDISKENLAVARELLDKSAVSERVRFKEGDLYHLPFEDDSFDWVWCADTLWPMSASARPVESIIEFARVVRPGGTIALVYWSNQSMLSGHPVLEARLNSAFSETTPYLSSVSPNLHFLRARGWMKAAGLEHPAASTFIAEIKGPLDADMREAMAFCFSMFWDNLESKLSADDWREYQRLCMPDSEDFVANNPDYYGFVTYTLFRGDVAKKV